MKTKEIDYSFNNKCIDCHSINIEVRGKTEIFKRDVYLCSDCLRVFSVENGKYCHAGRAEIVNGKVCIIA